MRKPAAVVLPVGSLLALGLVSTGAIAQWGPPQPPPPGAPTAQPGPAPAPPPGAAPGAPGAPTQPPPGPAPAAAPAAPGAPPPAGQPAWSFGASVGPSGVSAEGAAPPAPEDKAAARDRALLSHNTIMGSAGLLRVYEPGAGADGTFRLSLLMDWFRSSDFLCNGDAVCTPGNVSNDEQKHFGAAMGLSATPVEFLEVFAALRSYANSNDKGRPRLLQVLGDTNIGLKGFMPTKLGDLFGFGGSAEMLMLNGSGGVGLESKSTSYRLRAIGGADFRKPGGQGAPVRVMLNVGYLFDNSGKIVEDTETARGNRPITRLERYGLGINRVDSFQIGLGLQAPLEKVQPFAEYTVDIPVNRQGYTCAPSKSFTGDACLGNESSFAITPSRLSLGTRVTPWLRGFQGTLAFDIGTSGVKKFVEEVAPQAPWTLWVGLGYAFDTQERPAVETVKTVEKIVMPPAPPDRHVRGFVHEKDQAAGIANAIVRYEGRDITGMVTGADGRFVTQGLDPGTYNFSIHAEGYKDGQCTAAVVAAPPAAPMGAPPGAAPAPGTPTAAPGPPGWGAPPPPAPGQPPAPPGQPGMAPPAGAPPVQPTGPTYVDIDCAIEALPRRGGIIGQVLDSAGMAGVGGASVRLTDAGGRELAVSADGTGGFRYQDLPPGTATIKVEAEGYMLHLHTVEVRAREDARVQVVINKRPANKLVEVAGNEIKVKQQIHFETDSAKIKGDSTAILEEIADTIVRSPKLKKIEIQGHTDNSGTAEHNKVLSEQRAHAVRDWLSTHGVESSRLVAKGYGQERPLGPNLNEAGRAKNRRVQFIILDREGGGAAAPEPGAAPKPKPKPAMPF